MDSCQFKAVALYMGEQSGISILPESIIIMICLFRNPVKSCLSSC